MRFVLFFFHLLLSLTLPFSLLTPLWRGMQMKTVFILYPLLPFLACFSALFLPVALKMLKWQNEHIWTFCSCTSFKHHVGENLRLELNSMLERGMRNYSCMRDNLCFSLGGIVWINEWEKWRKWLERRGEDRELCVQCCFWDVPKRQLLYIGFWQLCVWDCLSEKDVTRIWFNEEELHQECPLETEFHTVNQKLKVKMQTFCMKINNNRLLSKSSKLNLNTTYNADLMKWFIIWADCSDFMGNYDLYIEKYVK